MPQLIATLFMLGGPLALWLSTWPAAREEGMVTELRCVSVFPLILLAVAITRWLPKHKRPRVRAAYESDPTYRKAVAIESRLENGMRVSGDGQALAAARKYIAATKFLSGENIQGGVRWGDQWETKYDKGWFPSKTLVDPAKYKKVIDQYELTK